MNEACSLLRVQEQLGSALDPPNARLSRERHRRLRRREDLSKDNLRCLLQSVWHNVYIGSV
jgi:hypothetical protein